MLDFFNSAGSSAYEVATTILIALAVIGTITFIFFGLIVIAMIAIYRRRALAKEKALIESDQLPTAVDNILKRPLPSGTFGKFCDGFRTPLDGFRMMSVYPLQTLWRYSVAPAIASLLVTILVIVGLAIGIAVSAEALHDQFDSTWKGALMEIGAFALIVVGSFGVAFITWLCMQAVFCGFFYTILAMKVEGLLGTPEDELKEEPLPRQILDTIIDILKLVFLMFPLLLLNIIPVLGSVISAIGSIYVDSLFAGIEFVDYPMLIRAIPRAERRQFSRKNRAQTLGLGAAVVCIILLPGIGVVLLSTAVTGSCLLYQRLGKNSA
ncbi:MAG: hypothetical protein CMJ78_27815 [Planctomycetaceae bacterium]|nr:hypothetical protein [Planctomycetaceae bacterium]